MDAKRLVLQLHYTESTPNDYEPIGWHPAPSDLVRDSNSKSNLNLLTKKAKTLSNKNNKNKNNLHLNSNSKNDCQTLLSDEGQENDDDEDEATFRPPYQFEFEECPLGSVPTFGARLGLSVYTIVPTIDENVEPSSVALESAIGTVEFFVFF